MELIVVYNEGWRRDPLTYYRNDNIEWDEGGWDSRRVSRLRYMFFLRFLDYINIFHSVFCWAWRRDETCGWTSQWRRLKGVAHLRRLWWRPTLMPHGSSKQALGVNFCSCCRFLNRDNKRKRKRSQSASSHACSDFIEEPEAMPEYWYTYVSDSD